MIYVYCARFNLCIKKTVYAICILAYFGAYRWVRLHQPCDLLLKAHREMGERSNAEKCDREKLCNKKRKQVWWRKKIDSSSCYGKKSIGWFIVFLLLNFDWSCWYSKCMCVCVCFFNAWNFNIFILFLSRWHNVCLFNIANGGNIVGIPMWSQHKLECTHRNVWESMLNLHSLISS